MNDNDGSDDRIEEIHKLVRKNYSMTKKMYDAQRRASIFGVLNWAIIIVLAVIAYIYIEPYITQLESMYGAVNEASERIQEGLDKIPGV